MKQLKIVLLTLCLIVSQWTHAEQKASKFEPYFSFETGFSVTRLSDFKVSSLTFSESDLAISLALGYQISQDWGVWLSYGEYGYKSLTRPNPDVAGGPPLNVRHGFNLYTLTSTYRIPITNWLDLNLNAGVIIGDDTEASRECILFSSFTSCDSWTPYEVNQAPKIAPVIGTSLLYKFSESWGIKLGYQYSSYRQGLTKTDLIVRFDF